MGRQHIHFVETDSEDAVSKGFGSDCDLFVHVNMQLAMASGLKFYRTPDGMIVSDGLDGTICSSFLSAIYHRHSRQLLWLQEAFEYHI